MRPLRQRLEARADLASAIRLFFQQRGVLEIQPPVLDAATVTDPHIHSFSVDQWFLQTSPEYAMKRLLAEGAGSIFALSPVFRRGEVGRLHRSEFTMLEWYRPGFDLDDLREEVQQLIEAMLPGVPRARVTSYRTLFEDTFGVNPHRADAEQLEALIQQMNIDHHVVNTDQGYVDDLRDLLFSTVVQPTLAGPVFVTNFPESQASLARVHEHDGDRVSTRFELYYQGLELANAYDEETDAATLRNRAARDNVIRRARGLAAVEVDERLLEAVEAMGQTAGVALGFDRLLMVREGLQDIQEVMLF